jgi:multicomponent Na+:H+ antiporter subunit E
MSKEVNVQEKSPSPLRNAAPELAQHHPLALRRDPPAPLARWRRFLVNALALALLWGILTDFRVDALVFGVPAILAGAALVFLIPQSPSWRLSPRGALAFVLWFAVQSVRGAIDVALRALAPSLPLRPGFRTYRPALPQGAPHITFLNTITLLPGTLSAEVAGDQVVVHMLDTRADLNAELGALESRIADLFGLVLNPEGAQ